MNWKEKVLFHLMFSGGSISAKRLEPLLMEGIESYDKSIDRIKQMIDENLIDRHPISSYSFRITSKGEAQIIHFFEDSKELMKAVRIIIDQIIQSRTDIHLNGDTNGLYFSYIGLSMFRFYPYKSKNSCLLLLKLPNLIEESIEYKSNELYLSFDIIKKTSFLSDIVLAHLKMIDDYYQ